MSLIWNRSTWRLTSEQKEEIARRYRQTKVSARQLAKEYGLHSHAAVLSIVKTRRLKGKR
jgi:transposase-like protein